MAGDSTFTTSGTSSTTHNSFVTAFPSPNLAHQLPVKLTSSNFLLWKTQFLPMIRGYGDDYNIEVSEGILPQLVGAETARKVWTKLVTAYASSSKPQIREGNFDRLAALQHPVSNDDLVEFVLIELGPTYRPFTRSLESRQEEISFGALYGMLLNEEWQLNRDETLTIIAPTTQFTQSSFTPYRGRGRGGRGNRGRGRYQNQGFS
ncbi:hypothetical protein H5410_061396 [Solanum commersonii]|uniref:Retrotransposon Copia-like N-terminal domain-containing protein n=1 Tax=Solanum commersonii TaxID=4109 RepID=A0A9J5W9I5_SOLCO|nr:hypothetical protein H5410_061396 [Solanum commersonii]